MIPALSPSMITDRHAQAVARGRQALLMVSLIPKLDHLILEAATARVSAPGLIEIREWCEYCLTENAISAAPSLNIKPDPVKDAIAFSVVAARSGNAAAYDAAAIPDEELAFVKRQLEMLNKDHDSLHLENVNLRKQASRAL